MLVDVVSFKHLDYYFLLLLSLILQSRKTVMVLHYFLLFSFSLLFYGSFVKLFVKSDPRNLTRISGLTIVVIIIIIIVVIIIAVITIAVPSSNIITFETEDMRRWEASRIRKALLRNSIPDLLCNACRW